MSAMISTHWPGALDLAAVPAVGHRHIVASDDVEAERHVLDAGRLRVDALVALVQDQIHRLVEAAEKALAHRERERRRRIPQQRQTMSPGRPAGRRAGDGLTTMFRPSHVMTLMISTRPGKEEHSQASEHQQVGVECAQAKAAVSPRVGLTIDVRLQCERHGDRWYGTRTHARPTAIGRGRHTAGGLSRRDEPPSHRFKCRSREKEKSGEERNRLIISETRQFNYCTALITCPAFISLASGLLLRANN